MHGKKIAKPTIKTSSSAGIQERRIIASKGIKAKLKEYREIAEKNDEFFACVFDYKDAERMCLNGTSQGGV